MKLLYSVESRILVARFGLVLLCAAAYGQNVGQNFADGNCTCGEWRLMSSQCSVTCGSGTQTLQRICNSDNTTLDTNCSSVVGTMETTMQPCTSGICPQLTASTSLSPLTTRPVLSCDNSDKDLSWTTAAIYLGATALVAFLLGCIITGLCCRRHYRTIISHTYLRGGSGEQFINKNAFTANSKRDWTEEQEETVGSSRRRFSREASHERRHELLNSDSIPMTVQEDGGPQLKVRPQPKPRQMDGREHSTVIVGNGTY